MWKTVAAIAVTLWVAQMAWADAPSDDLQIIGNYNMSWNLSVEPSLDFALSIQDILTPPTVPTANLLRCWQMRLTIIPDPNNATGAVSFGPETSFPPSWPTQPAKFYTGGGPTGPYVNDYVFEGQDGRTPDTTGLITGYLDWDAPGATVPTTATDLLHVELWPSITSISPEPPVGRFYIAVIPDSTPACTGAAWSYWSDDLDGYITEPFHGTDFGNAAPVYVGSVVIVPEPSNAVLLGSGLTVFAIGWLGYCHRSRRFTSLANCGARC